MSDEAITPTAIMPESPAANPSAQRAGTAPDNAGVGQEHNAQGQEPAWLPERLDRARKIAIADFLRDLGVETPDALKATLDEYRRVKESQMSEAEKAQAALEAAQKRAEAAEMALKEAQEKARLKDLHEAIRKAAAAAKARYPEDVIAWALSSGEDLTGLMDSEGAVNEKSLAALVDKARKARPEWFTGTGPGIPSNSGGHVPDADKAGQALGRRNIARLIRGA